MPILARLFSAPLDSVRAQAQALAHTPTTTLPDSELAIPDLAVECFVAFLVSNFWADSSFGSIEVALYEFVCGLLNSNAKTQVYVGGAREKGGEEGNIGGGGRREEKGGNLG